MVFGQIYFEKLIQFNLLDYCQIECKFNLRSIYFKVMGFYYYNQNYYCMLFQSQANYHEIYPKLCYYQVNAQVYFLKIHCIKHYPRYWENFHKYFRQFFINLSDFISSYFHLFVKFGLQSILLACYLSHFRNLYLKNDCLKVQSRMVYCFHLKYSLK